MGINPRSLPVALVLASLAGCQQGVALDLAGDTPEVGDLRVAESNTEITPTTETDVVSVVEPVETAPALPRLVEPPAEVDAEPVPTVEETAPDQAVAIGGGISTPDAYVPPNQEFIDRLLAHLPWAEPFLADPIFRRVILLAFFINPNAVDAGDLDGDTDLDLLWAQTQHDRVFIFSQIAPGSFAPSPALVGAREFTELPVAVAAVDVDEDGRTDVVSANALGEELTVFFQIGFGIFEPTPLQVAVPGEIEIYSVHAEDLDTDGDLDVAICGTDGDITAAFEQVRPRVFEYAPGL